MRRQVLGLEHGQCRDFGPTTPRQAPTRPNPMPAFPLSFPVCLLSSFAPPGLYTMVLSVCRLQYFACFSGKASAPRHTAMIRWPPLKPGQEADAQPKHPPDIRRHTLAIHRKILDSADQLHLHSTFPCDLVVRRPRHCNERQLSILAPQPCPLSLFHAALPSPGHASAPWACALLLPSLPSVPCASES